MACCPRCGGMWKSWKPVLTERSFIQPDWPAPAGVGALSTTRLGGASQGPWQGFNLGNHVGDDPAAVARNRQELADNAGLDPRNIGWLRQVHGTRVVSLNGELQAEPEADASISEQPGLACSILTADCLPVLFCNQAGTRVAAAHAGWRGLSAGVLEQVVAGLGAPETLMAWLGPAIGPKHFEVGPEVLDAFLDFDTSASLAFSARGARPGHFMADIWLLARQRLELAGVTQIYGGGLCTVSDPQRFFSYRRDGQTGRMASLIWLN